MQSSLPPNCEGFMSSPTIEEKVELNQSYGSFGYGNGLYPQRNPWQDDADAEGVPLIPPLDPQVPLDPNPVVAICGACGRKVRQVEMYSCSQSNCPIQSQVRLYSHLVKN